MEAGKKGSKDRKFSLFGVAALMMEQAKYLGKVEEYVGHLFLSVILVVTSLLVPVLMVVLLLVLWFIPLSIVPMRRFMLLYDILKAWQYSEVYLISIMVAVLQLSDVSGLLVNDFCASFQGALDGLVNLGLISPDDAQCLYVRASIQPGVYVLFIASIFLFLLSKLVTKLSYAVHEDRKLRLYKKLDQSISLTPRPESLPYKNGEISENSPIEIHEPRENGEHNGTLTIKLNDAIMRSNYEREYALNGLQWVLSATEKHEIEPQARI